jgi:hypothetical protein
MSTRTAAAAAVVGVACNFRQHGRIVLWYGLYAAHRVIQVRCGGGEILIAAFTALLFGVGGDPVFAVTASKVDNNVRLGLCCVATTLVRTGEGNACVRICFSVCQGSLRVICGNVLEVSGFLYKLAVWTVLADKLEIQLVVFLDVVIHGVLFVTLLVAVRANKCARFVADVGGVCRDCRDHCGN